jgi:hypothetical protein
LPPAFLLRADSPWTSIKIPTHPNAAGFNDKNTAQSYENPFFRLPIYLVFVG